MTNSKTVDDWVRYFRLAKTTKTLQIMSERCAAKAPELKITITIAANHRESEIMAGRLLEVDCGR